VSFLDTSDTRIPIVPPFVPLGYRETTKFYTENPSSLSSLTILASITGQYHRYADLALWK
jgi:hypothetical protein